MQFCIFTLKKLSDSSRLFGVEVSDSILINSIIRSIGMRKIQMVDLKGQYAAIKERVNESIRMDSFTLSFIAAYWPFRSTICIFLIPMLRIIELIKMLSETSTPNNLDESDNFFNVKIQNCMILKPIQHPYLSKWAKDI